MKKYKEYKPKIDLREPVQLDPFEVTLEECNGNTNKLIKKFMKKVRKAELLKPYYGRMMYHKTKSQKNREKSRKATYEAKKQEKRSEKNKDILEEQLYQQVFKK